jgi:excisionase family DNA binding protein
MDTKREKPAIAHDPKTNISDLLFPGRTVVNLKECAAKLGVTDQHILNLIELGELGAVDVGTGKIRHYRIPVKEWEKYLAANSSV